MIKVDIALYLIMQQNLNLKQTHGLICVCYWSIFYFNFSHSASKFGKSFHKSSPYDYNIVRTTRNYSRRDFKYDRGIEDIINVPKYRTKTSLEYSPTSLKNDVIVNR